MDLDELVFHPWSVQGPRTVPTFVGGSGSHVHDADGRRYLDFVSQLVFTNLGHQHPKIVAAIREQADRLCTLAPGDASDVRGEAARPGDPRCSPPTARTTDPRRPRST
jgi:taurine---2-oxoglutarate transaminase